MEYKSGCLICGDELLYSEYLTTETCFYCGVMKETNSCCSSGHYVCDTCHNGTANDLIERYCCSTGSTSPLSIAISLMKNPAVKMHGPEHHFLVPAVLLASFHNQRVGRSDDAAGKIRARQNTGGGCERGILRFLWRLRGSGRRGDFHESRNWCDTPLGH